MTSPPKVSSGLQWIENEFWAEDNLDSLLYASYERVSCHFSAHSWGLEIFLQFILYLSVLLLSRAEHHVQIDYFTKHSLLEIMMGRAHRKTTQSLQEH